MNWTQWIRKCHRWLSLAFTLLVIANLLVRGREPVALYVGLATLVPLFLLMLSGLYMFALPHVARWRAARETLQGRSPQA